MAMATEGDCWIETFAEFDDFSLIENLQSLKLLKSDVTCESCCNTMKLVTKNCYYDGYAL